MNFGELWYTIVLIWFMEFICSQMWDAEKNLTVDEMMMSYTGKYSPIRQYMKAKPTQYGIKIWCLANSNSKYVQRMEVYCGASTSEDDNHATGFKIVNQLMCGHEGKGHIVTCDNFFTSPKLFWCLLQKGIYA